MCSPVYGNILPNKECWDQQQLSCDDEGEAAHGGHVVLIDDVERRRTDEQSNTLNAANSSKQSPCCEGINSHQLNRHTVYKGLGEFVDITLFSCSHNPFTPELTVHSPNLLKRKCISKVVRICIKIIFHLSKLCKAKFSLLCDVIFLVGLEGKFDIDHSQE